MGSLLLVHVRWRRRFEGTVVDNVAKFSALITAGNSSGGTVFHLVSNESTGTTPTTGWQSAPC